MMRLARTARVLTARRSTMPGTAAAPSFVSQWRAEDKRSSSTHAASGPLLSQRSRCTAQLHTQCCAAHASTITAAAVPVECAAEAATPAASTTASTSAAPAAARSNPTAARPVRVRYAPSPTGSVHLGGLRTALYNYLVAKKAVAAAGGDPAAGQFLLRIEDTDQKRLVPGAVDELLRTLRWAGVEHDEGPGAATQGDCGPYVQSERLPIYHAHVEKLLESGHAYPCFCSAERLNDLRELQTKKGLPSMYDRLCLGMEDDERAAKLAEARAKGLPYVVRMKIPQHGSTMVRDLIRGQVVFPNKTLDDQVLLKSDGFPTYHLACVVDDHSMRISHVIRGDEWLTSTPKHVLLYRAFGWSVPSFAHLPLLLKPDGTKLSKRHADSSLEYYIQRGYLPEAVLNFVALLGWNPGTTREVFASREELVQAFSLERIQKAGAVVNLDKLNWFNQQHIVLLAQSDMNRLMDLVRPQLLQAHRASLPASASESSRAALEADLSDEPFLRRVVSSLAAHVTHVSDFAAQSRFYFHAPDYAAEDARQLREKVWPDKAAWELNKRLIDGTLEMLQSLPDASFDVPPPPPTSSVAQAGSTAVSASIPPAAAAAAAATPSSPSAAPSIQESLKRVLKQHGAGAKQKTYFLLLRFVLTGSESGPAISVMLATLGRQRALQRLRQADAYTPPIPVPSS